MVRRVFVVGLLLGLYQAAYFASVAAWGVARATLVALGGAPVLVALARVLRDRTRPDGATALSVALGVGGLTLLVLPALLTAPGAGAARGGPDAVLPGVLLAAAAAATFAVVTLVNRRPVAGLSPVTTTGAAFTVGGLVLLPLALAGVGAGGGADGDGSGSPADVVGLVLLLGSVPTAAAWVSYFSGLPHVSAQRATVLALLEPLTAAVAALVVLGEPLGPAAVAGGALLLGATALAGRPARPVPGAPVTDVPTPP